MREQTADAFQISVVKSKRRDFMGRLDTKTALVTGGARGLGRGIVLEFAREGADIVIADVLVDIAEQTAADVRALGRQATVVRMDVTDAQSVRVGIQRALTARGGLDILVNNAGVAPVHTGSEVDEEDWDRCYEVNLKGIWKVSQAVVPHFLERGAGKIVNIASIAGRRGSAWITPYNASKAGVISLTQSQAMELGPHNINVNAICPGLIWTDIWRGLGAILQGEDDPVVHERRQRFDMLITSSCPLRREQTPEDIGKAAVFLASEDARNITGQALNVDGGIVMN
jgi:meso-butanediol dehydrogenase/(S,S)-butanediol dehydrogenase/diacetyl reductase